MCHGMDLEWRAVSGRASLTSWIIVNRAPPGVTLPAPYVVGLVQLEEGPSMMTNIVDPDDNDTPLAVDAPLEVGFESRVAGGPLAPVFHVACRGR